MITIHKYAITKSPHNFAIHKGGKILTAQMQNGGIKVWALVDTDQGYDSINFYTIGTGEGFPQVYNATYINTIQDGYMSWHIFYTWQ